MTRHARLHKSGNRKWFKRVALVISAIIIGVVLFTRRADAPDLLQLAADDAALASPPNTVNGRYLFSGTVVLSRAVERAAKTDERYDYDQPFSGLNTFEPQAYDAWSADLECPVTSREVNYEEQVSKMVFNCRPEFLPPLARYITIAGLANNHTADMGAEGFAETLTHLDKAGIQSYGHYDPSELNDTCQVIALPVRVQHADNSETKSRLPAAFCAWHYFFRNPLPGEIEVMERYAARLPVFGFIHAGAEYVAKAGADQVNVARLAVDLGAEFVIGNSAHWVQNSEVYKGKPIFYSTGNFIFDQLDYETQRGVSIDVTLSVAHDDNVAKWLALGEQCSALRDTCLEEAETQKLQKVAVSLSYAPVGNSGGNKKVTRKADATLQAAIEERINWADTLNDLTQ